MVYIRSDGTVAQGMRPRATDPLNNAFWGLPSHWKAVAVGILVLACRRWLSPNPFAGGKIPASALGPEQHWKRIKDDDLFVRSMTDPLGKKTYWQGRKESMERMKELKDGNSKHLDIMMDKYDFGGPDGHVAEAGDWSDLKYVQGTRCSTTRSAVTAYFCGADVAENQDVGLANKRKGVNLGVESFSDFLVCRHQQGQQTGSHRRSVYRLGIGCKDPLAGYSHAFSIIAQPDGTFYWLQSFIGHYSLPQWMSKTNPDGSPHAHLSLEQLQAKLQQMIRLMNISAWTDQANEDYLELFGVDKHKESWKRKRNDISKWNPDHRLDIFTWDEACEYPLLSTNATESDHETTPKSNSFDWGDECVRQNLMEQLTGTTRSTIDLASAVTTKGGS